MSLITGMSLEEQVGQLLAVGFPSTTPSQDVLDLIQKRHVGNIILFKRNIRDAEQVFELTRTLQKVARDAGHRFPLAIMIDQENGMVRRFGESTTIFPGNMALGAIDSEEMAFAIAEATGRELHALGISMNLAPVVDVNNNPENPVIGVRSFGEDPHRVARLGAAMVRGYQAAGIITTLKHFPGHGDTSVDSHLALPVITHAREHLDAVELLPFREAIAAGADCVMPAHIYLPALSQEEGVPATLSSAILTTLLRETLGFSGVIISDCMEMRAISDTVGTEQGTVKALQAGVDLVLVSHTYARQQRSLAAILDALRTGTLSVARVENAAERVLQLKQNRLSWDSLPGKEELRNIKSEAHQHLSDAAYERSTTLVKDTQKLVPLSLQADEHLLLLFLRPDIFGGAIDTEFPGVALTEYVKQRHGQTKTCSVTASSTQNDSMATAPTAHAIEEADTIVVVTANARQNPFQASIVQQLLQTNKPVIVIAAYNPYDLLVFPQLSTYLVTYEYTRPAFTAVGRVLFGATTPQGRLPLTLQT